MKLIEENITQTIDEIYIIETLNLNGKTILELGCGAATMTKKIAQNGFDRTIIACEVDETQYKKNLLNPIENVEYMFCGAENIKLEDKSVDFVFMFKSFHHVPKELMSKALNEIKRVLKPNGLAYISEPLFAGEQNELVAIFHDEEEVRKNAFDSIKDSVEKNEFKLFKEFFFQTEVKYSSFEDFKKRQMNLSYNNDNSNEEIEKKVKERFESFDGANRVFLKPFRVEILQKL